MNLLYDFLTKLIQNTIQSIRIELDLVLYFVFSSTPEIL